MANKKIPVRVMVQDDKVMVSYGGGCWYQSPIDNTWLWVLDAICYSEEHELQIQDHREHREEHQRKLSTDHPEER